MPLDEELERLGEIRIWSELPHEEQQRVLHPPADKVHLVCLPFIGLFPLLDDIIRCLKGQPSRLDVRTLLEQNRLWQEGQITELGRMILRVLESGQEDTAHCFREEKAWLIYSALTLAVYVWIICWVLARRMPVLSLLTLFTFPFAMKAIQGDRRSEH